MELISEANEEKCNELISKLRFFFGLNMESTEIAKIEF